MPKSRVIGLAFIAVLSLNTSTSVVPKPEYRRVYRLPHGETVFAYARISPDGRYLAYSSYPPPAAGAPPRRLLQVVDLNTKHIVFAEPGIDPYWSSDGRRMIFLSHRLERPDVSIRNADSTVTRTVAPPELGDYYSWGRTRESDVILTIDGYYFTLSPSGARLPAARVGECPGIGRGERPLLSKDGNRISVFVRGYLVVRNLTDCTAILNTGMRGAKADFSWDGRYLAFHAPKQGTAGFEIQIVDLQKWTAISWPSLQGSSFFPNWTVDGKLMFRYDGPDFNGFVLADNPLRGRVRNLPRAHAPPVNKAIHWWDVFPAQLMPGTSRAVVLVWAPWSAHSQDALTAFQSASQSLRRSGDVSFSAVVDFGSPPGDSDRILRQLGVRVDQLPSTPLLRRTGAVNQIPTTLLFERGVLIDQRLGAQNVGALLPWLAPPP